MSVFDRQHSVVISNAIVQQPIYMLSNTNSALLLYSCKGEFMKNFVDVLFLNITKFGNYVIYLNELK